MTSPKTSAKGSKAPGSKAPGSKALGPAKAKAAPEPFWRVKTLTEMSRSEWESLCDGCARCCLVKLEYDDTGEVDHTEIACRLLDLKTCQCSDYAHRREKVQDCLSLTPAKVRQLKWLPSTCAYRLVAEGRDLYWWHHLVSGDRETVHQAGISVRGRVVSEDKAGPPEEHIIDWID